MRHRKRSIRFGRQPAHRKATLVSLLKNLILYKRIETTLAKAKETKRLADRLISWAKKGSVHHRRLAYSILGDRDLVGLIFKEIAPLFTNRQGGYTRVVHTRNRQGDGAQLAILEWTEKKEILAKNVQDKKIKKEKPGVKAAKEEIHKKELPAPERPAPTAEKPRGPEQEPKQPVEKPEVKAEKPKVKEKEQKGFLGGLRRLFGKKKKD